MAQLLGLGGGEPPGIEFGDLSLNVPLTARNELVLLAEFRFRVSVPQPQRVELVHGVVAAVDVEVEAACVAEGVFGEVAPGRGVVVAEAVVGQARRAVVFHGVAKAVVAGVAPGAQHLPERPVQVRLHRLAAAIDQQHAVADVVVDLVLVAGRGRGARVRPELPRARPRRGEIACGLIFLSMGRTRTPDLPNRRNAAAQPSPNRIWPLARVNHPLRASRRSPQ